jgi:hypothetical protein
LINLTNALIYLVIVLIVLCYPKSQHVFRDIFLTLLAVEFLAQYVASLNLWLKTDIFTVYLCIWQLISLVSNWMGIRLLPPVLIIEQASYCVATAWFAWMFHFIYFRYIPVTIKLSALWVGAIIDT